MYNKKLVLKILQQTLQASLTIQKRFQTIHSPEEFLTSDAGMERLDSICMLFIAIGESLKNLDKVTSQTLLTRFPEVEWKQAKGMRDMISHHYFDLNADLIYNTCEADLATLIETLHKIIAEIEEK